MMRPRGPFEGALHEAIALDDRQIRAEHVLLGLLAAQPGTAGLLLRRAGTDLDGAGVRARLMAELGRGA